MPRIEQRVTYSRGVIGSLSVPDLRVLNKVLTDASLNYEDASGELQVIDKALQYFQFVVETEGQVRPN